MRPRGNRIGDKRRFNFSTCGPASLVAAEIHLGHKRQRASATAGCTATYKLRATSAGIKYIINTAGYADENGTWQPPPLSISSSQPKN
jgi:hypothetical protein